MTTNDLTKIAGLDGLMSRLEGARQRAFVFAGTVARHRPHSYQEALLSKLTPEFVGGLDPSDDASLGLIMLCAAIDQARAMDPPPESAEEAFSLAEIKLSTQ